jgi:hypothetical protein
VKLRNLCAAQDITLRAAMVATLPFIFNVKPRAILDDWETGKV